MGECAEHNEEHNAGRDPTPVFVSVDDFISGKGDKQGAEGDDQDTSVSRDIAIYGVQELGANDGIGSGPTDTGDNVEDGDCRGYTG